MKQDYDKYREVYLLKSKLREDIRKLKLKHMLTNKQVADKLNMDEKHFIRGYSSDNINFFNITSIETLIKVKNDLKNILQSDKCN